MKRRKLALALSTCFLVLSGCDKQRVFVPLQIPIDRMDCTTIEGERPAIPPEYVIDWSVVASVEKAKAEHQAFVTRLRQRENPVAGYIVKLEGRLFACADDAGWLRDYTARLP